MGAIVDGYSSADGYSSVNHLPAAFARLGFPCRAALACWAAWPLHVSDRPFACNFLLERALASGAASTPAYGQGRRETADRSQD